MKDKYHFIGIGGIGMSALANILLQKGFQVTGSDDSTSYITQALQKLGAQIFIGHSQDNIQAPCAVVYSTAVKEENPEVRKAKEEKIPFLHRSELLHQLMEGYAPLLVAGTHGKTTTSSLLAHLLVDSGLDPAYAIGGVVTSLHSNGGYGRGSYFIAEADESDGSFLKYRPFGAILTNIDNDHLDYWKDLEHLVGGFRQFSSSVLSSQHLLWCGDDPFMRGMDLPGFSYGFEENNDWHIENFRQEGWKNIFDLSFQEKEYTEIEIPLIGAHNVLNAAAVFGLGMQVDISEEKIRKAFTSFCGISRRMELKGEKQGISIFDDYAHHPTEIFATLRAVKHAIGHRRLIVAFQPHRYTRTKDCLNEFPAAFASADQLILTEIYAAREAPIEGITSDVIAAKMRAGGKKVSIVPCAELPSFLMRNLHSGDVLVTMGAGDITKVGPEVLKLLQT